ncbi:MAG: MotA/TolQ/ExbB proton channel family protein [Pseudomonadota bacterium]
MATLWTTIASFISLGGPVVVLLLLLSVVAVALSLLKIFQFRLERVGRHKTVRNAVLHWQSGQKSEAKHQLNASAGILSDIVKIAIDGIDRRKLHREEIDEAVAVTATNRLHKLQSGFRVLDFISQIAPLLGLFGTVLGMIEAFQKLQGAGSVVDPAILAGGIWVALLTTAVGLAVAMPVSLILTWLESRIENERVSIETNVSGILNTVLQRDTEPQNSAQSDGSNLALAHAN